MPKAYVYDEENYKIMKMNSGFKLSNEISQFFYCPWQ